MLSLKFKPRDVENFEEQKNISIYEWLMPTVKNIVDLIQLGAGCERDKAYDLLELQLDSGKDLFDVIEDIGVILRKQGFLHKEMNVENYVTSLESLVLEFNKTVAVPENQSPSPTQPQEEL